MTDETFAAHDRLDPTDGPDRQVTSVVFDAVATPHDDGGYEVRVVVPTLEAAVTTDDVGETVAAGWFETLERRLADPSGVVRGTVEAVDVDRDGEEVVVTIRASGSTQELRADDAAALAEYVEGTYVEGLIPGYAYVEPVAGLRDAAVQRYDGQ